MCCKLHYVVYIIYYMVDSSWFLVGLERYQAQHPIPNTLASNDTNTDTGSDVIRSNKNT